MKRLLNWMFRNVSPPFMLVIVLVLCIILVVGLAHLYERLSQAGPLVT